MDAKTFKRIGEKMDEDITMEKKKIKVDGLVKSATGNVTFDKSKKNKVLSMVLHFHYNVWKSVIDSEGGDSSVYDVEQISNITSYLYNIHNDLRKGSLTAKNTEYRKDEAVRVSGTEIPKGELLTLWRQLVKAYGFEYTKPGAGEKDHWYGIIAPIICFMLGYKFRYNEMRLGTSTYKVGSSDEYESRRSLSSMGIMPEHRLLVDGITMPPAVKSSLAQSLGPMTILSCIFAKPFTQYETKWEEAFNKVFKLFPHKKEILTTLRAGGPIAMQLMTIMADICVLGASRSTNRAYFPAACYLAILDNDAAWKTHNTLITQTAFQNIAGVKAINEIDHSGKGMWLFYHAIPKGKLITKGEAGLANIYGALMAYGIFGFHKEDLGLLNKMSGTHWPTRREIGDKLKGKGSMTNAVKIVLPTFRIICKLNTGSATNHMSGEAKPMCRYPTLAGRMQGKITESLYEFLHKKDNTVQLDVMHSNPAQLIQSLRNLLTQLKERVIEQGSLDLGLSDFHTLEGTTKDEYGRKAIIDTADMTPRLFLD